MKPTITHDESGRTVYTLSLPGVNRFALLLSIPIILFLGLPYYLLWGENVLLALKFKPLMFLFLFIILGIVIHELLHGIVWAVFAKGNVRSIRFGIKWEYLTPYCHCIVPLKIWQYIAGGLTPLILMGIIPSCWGMLKGNTLFMFFGMFYIWTAAGDILAVWLLRKFPPGKWIHDHPKELGFIFENDEPA